MTRPNYAEYDFTFGGNGTDILFKRTKDGGMNVYSQNIVGDNKPFALYFFDAVEWDEFVTAFVNRFYSLKRGQND